MAASRLAQVLSWGLERIPSTDSFTAALGILGISYGDWLYLQGTKPKSTLYTNGPNRFKDAAAVSSHSALLLEKSQLSSLSFVCNMSFPLAAFKISLYY